MNLKQKPYDDKYPVLNTVEINYLKLQKKSESQHNKWRQFIFHLASNSNQMKTAK